MSSRNYVSPYDSMVTDSSIYKSDFLFSTPETTPSLRRSSTPTRCYLTFLKLSVVSVITAYLILNIYGFSPTKMAAMVERIQAFSITEEVEEEEEHDAGNIMTLGPPWVYFRDIVLDLPVQDEDATFMWITHGPTGVVLKDLFTDCLGLTLQSYSGAIDLDLDISQFTRTKGLTSPDIRDVATLFSPDQFGRMFAFFRHPFQIWQEKASNKELNNPMVRLVLGMPTEKLSFVELGMAKKVIREKCVVGLLDEDLFELSFHRLYEYFGWEDDGTNPAMECFNKHASDMVLDPYGEFWEHDSDEWREFHEENQYDLQLYEYSRTAFRAGYQTIVERGVQKGRLQEEEEEEEEEEEN